MIQQQILQLIFWSGVILCLPAFYRFSYVGSAFLWRKIFPTRRIEIHFTEYGRKKTNKVTITLDRKNSKRVAQLIKDAERE